MERDQTRRLTLVGETALIGVIIRKVGGGGQVNWKTNGII